LSPSSSFTNVSGHKAAASAAIDLQQQRASGSTRRLNSGIEFGGSAHRAAASLND
jgi:hypothetical protein